MCDLLGRRVASQRSSYAAMSHHNHRYGIDDEGMVPCYPRERLRRLHNGKDVVMAMRCWWTALNCTTGLNKTFYGADDEHCLEDAALSRLHDFERCVGGPTCCMGDLMWTHHAVVTLLSERRLALDSQFGVVSAGEGTHSYRLCVPLSYTPSQPLAQLTHMQHTSPG